MTLPPRRSSGGLDPGALVTAAAFVALLLGAASAVVAVGLSGPVESELVSTEATRPAELAALGLGVALLVVGLLAARRLRAWLPEVAAAVRAAAAAGRAMPAGSSLADLVTAPLPAPESGRWFETDVPSDRRLARVTTAWLVAAMAVVIVAAGLVILAVDRDMARAAWTALAAAAFVLLGGLPAAHGLVARIARRQAAALALVDPEGHPWPEAPQRFWPGLAIAGCAIAAVIPMASASAPSFSERVCYSTELACRWLEVPADQTLADRRGATTTIGYGHTPATGRRLGTLLMLPGGPGISGLATWDLDFAALDPAIRTHYDLVTIDPRGVGGSGGVDCPLAVGRYGTAVDLDADPSVVETFATACIAEAGVPEEHLGRYAGDEVVEDIEAIRRHLGVDRFVVYGASYGTATATRYAQAHPEHVSALILDGLLDIAADTDTAWLEAARSFERVLDRTFDWCRRDAACRAELPDPAAAWDRVMERLAAEPGLADYADPRGRMATWQVDASSAAFALGDGLYSEAGRMLLLRSIAAADRGDLIPLARLVNPEADLVGPDVLSSEFAYVASWCADRVELDPPLDPAAYLARAREASLGAGRMRDVALSGWTCTAWPVAADAPPPETLPLPRDVPVVVLTSTADPITPADVAARVVERWRGTSSVTLIRTLEGPHVTFARGDTCVDGPIVDLLVEGTTPAESITCTGRLAVPYQGVVRAYAASGLELRARALDDEVILHPEVVAWPGTYDVRVGCRHGGVFTIRPRVSGDAIEFDACAVLPGEPVSGSGRLAEDGGVTYDVRSERGEWQLDVSHDGSARLTGQWDGEAVEASW